MSSAIAVLILRRASGASQGSWLEVEVCAEGLLAAGGRLWGFLHEAASIQAARNPANPREGDARTRTVTPVITREHE